MQKSMTIGYHNGGTWNVWIPIKCQRTYKQI